jgi:hypothetical protein
LANDAKLGEVIIVEQARTDRTTGADALREQELLDRAEVYRDMAKRAHSATLRDEFNERAERYETVAAVVKRRPMPAK